MHFIDFICGLAKIVFHLHHLIDFQLLYNNAPAGNEEDPKLAAPGSKTIIGFGNELKDLNAYQLLSESPAKDKGITIESGIGERDYFGNLPLKGLSQDIGAHEL